MKTQIKQTIGFTLEIVFFILTGGHLVNRHWLFAGITFFIAMIFAVWTGKQIKQEGREEIK